MQRPLIRSADVPHVDFLHVGASDVGASDVDGIEDPERWIHAGVEACRAVWERSGRRYGRRLAAHDRVRDAAADVSALAARRVVPLTAPVQRPLPSDGLRPVARAFNALDPADRYALLRLRDLSPLRGARAEHAASAFARLAQALVDEESGPRAEPRETDTPGGDGDRPPPGVGSIA